MSSIKIRYSKIFFGVASILSMIILFVLPGCKQKKDKSTSSQPNQGKVATPAKANPALDTPTQTRIPYPQKAPSGQFFYLTKNYTKAALDQVKKKELDSWHKEISQEFGLTFKTKYTQKYFNIAYRCSQEQVDFLLYNLKMFFEPTYPKYFRYEPSYPFKIVYFGTKKEYSRYTGSEAYGFYLPKTKTLYTYANSGEGTLWHELVHAFVDANTHHQVQQWFSEGFASFYEMAAVYGNKFHEGYTNWRHPTLKKKIRKKEFLPLTDFMQEKYMSEGHGYAKARFLFCYLWIHHKMPDFVNAYLYELAPKYKGKELGKQAIKTLEKMLGKDLTAIEQDYKKRALTYGKMSRLKKIKK
ncbi:hypothetical protein [uncultured Microscilla sp.]|uniref:hypothetical protein n=1 Tax=uncultured Microscilla sp. TaxID=432653 RepID=UPI00261C4123|nr:hypothetical protein [uncultured Microscilla sp.]